MGKRRFLDMNGYQWTVLFAAWLGWGFDVFDGLLFNYVAPNCVPTLLGLEIGSPEAKKATLTWVGILTSLLLVGWGIGGIVFGRICDRIGRTKTLLLTMLLYAIGTFLCAFAPNIWILALCRLIASLGIGGEWAAGAAMVAEVVPEKRRVEAGAILYSSAPMGLFLAAFVTKYIQGTLFSDRPEIAWRYVFVCGLLPALVAFIVRLFVKEPERWKQATEKADPPRISELFTPRFKKITLSGLGMAVVALLTWWSCNAFIPTVAGALAAAEAKIQGLDPKATQQLIETWKASGSNWFNLGGLIGTLLTVPIAKNIGRRVMYGGYFLGSGIAIMTTFGLDVPAPTRLFLCFFIGLTVFGVFGSFTYYLPELYPTRLRATGAGFCYNAGRFIAAIGPPIVGSVAAMGADTLATAMKILFWVGLVPIAGMLLLPLVVETKNKELAD
ncbi:MAG: MFS transporter [Fimbriimonadaceae bacterium]